MPQLRTSDGVRLDFTDTGPTGSRGAGLTFVLLAGYTAPATSWAFQEDAFTAAGHRVVCLDRRSHGRSQAPAHGHRMARHGQDLRELLAAQSWDDVVLVGGSMGASTVWSYLGLVGSGREHRVRGVVSIDQTPRMLNTEAWRHGYYGFGLDNAGTFFAEGIPPTGRGRDAVASAAARQRLVERTAGDLPGFGLLRPETLPLLNDHALADWRDVVTTADVPVLALAGRESELWPCEHADATAALARDGRAVVVEECGHAANIDQPDAVNEAVLTWTADL